MRPRIVFLHGIDDDHIDIAITLLVAEKGSYPARRINKSWCAYAFHHEPNPLTMMFITVYAPTYRASLTFSTARMFTSIMLGMINFFAAVFLAMWFLYSIAHDGICPISVALGATSTLLAITWIKYQQVLILVNRYLDGCVRAGEWNSINDRMIAAYPDTNTFIICGIADAREIDHMYGHYGDRFDIVIVMATGLPELLASQKNDMYSAPSRDVVTHPHVVSGSVKIYFVRR